VAGAEWDRITFVAKSRGTLFLSVMPPLDTAATVEAIWVTPLLDFDYVNNGIVEKRWRSLIVAGSADPYHEAAAHDATCAAIHADSLVVDGADHGLVVRGDVRRTVKGFADLADATLAFAQQ
jgi:hypothetical protein